MRVVSIRPEVQLPEASRRGVISRLPLPSSATLFVLDVIVSTSPVPQFAAPPGYEVPVSYCQSAVFTAEPAAPLKSSMKTWSQPEGGAGAVAFAVAVAAVATAAARPSAATTATSARRSGRGLAMPEVSLMGRPSGCGVSGKNGF